MNKNMPSFDEIAIQFEPLIKSQIKRLRIYKEYDQFYQCGLIGLWNAYKKFDPEKGDFAAYALRTVRGHLLMELKKENHYTERHCPQDETILNMSDPNCLTPFDEEILLSYCETLSEKQLLWVKQAIFLQKKQREIAEEFGVSIETVKTWRKEALKKLRKNVKFI